MKTVSIIQPSFLPWQGYFAFIKRSEHFIFYDDVQYDKHGWRNRNQIVANNKLTWISVPVLNKGKSKQFIYEATIDNTQSWAKKILGQVKSHYSKAPHFNDYFPWLQEILTRNWTSISELNIALTIDVCRHLDIKCHFSKSSDYQIPDELDRIQRLIFLINACQGKNYLSGPSAQSYITNTDVFVNAGIQIEFFNYTQPQYKQFTSSFTPYASIIDLLFHQGPESSNFIFDL